MLQPMLTLTHILTKPSKIINSFHLKRLHESLRPYLKLDVAAEGVGADGPLHGEGDLAALVADGEGGRAEGPVLQGTNSNEKKLA